MKYTLRWGDYERYENNEVFDGDYEKYENYEVYDSDNPDFIGVKESVRDMAISDMNELIADGVDWCSLYKDGELIYSYDIFDEFKRQEIEDEI